MILSKKWCFTVFLGVAAGSPLIREISQNIKTIGGQKPFIGGTKPLMMGGLRTKSNFGDMPPIGGMMPGGVTSQKDVENGRVYAEFAVNEKSDDCGYEVSEIIDYKTQVVAGMLANVKYTIKSKKNCPAKECKSSVVEQVWMNPQRRLQSHQCKTTSSNPSYSGGLTGGIEPQPHSKDGQVHAQLALEKMESPTCAYKVDIMTDYSTQVVSGFMHRVEYTAVSKNCKKLVCKSAIWSQPWMGPDKVNEHKCTV